MLRSALPILCLMALLSACSNYTPRDKAATFDPTTNELVMPYPCPDWSQSQTHNYLNENHSNFGCSVNTNAAVQLDNPRDLYQGHGINSPDTEISDTTIQQYRAGTLPKALTPMQSDAVSSGQ